MRKVFQLKYELPLQMLSIFATMDLTHALLIGDDPYYEASFWFEFGDSEVWWGNVKRDDPFIECLAILSQLGNLGYESRHFRDTTPIKVLLSIQTALETQAARQQEGDQTPESRAWNAFCACYRFTASVYLYRALSVLDVDHPLVQRAVTDCMAVISGPDLTDNLHHCIFFPVLIIGSHCLVEDQRAEIRRSIARNTYYLSFEALRSFESFLEKRWAELDSSPELQGSNWWMFFQEIASVTCLF